MLQNERFQHLYNRVSSPWLRKILDFDDLKCSRMTHFKTFLYYFFKFSALPPTSQNRVYILPISYRHPVIILNFAPRCETLFNKTSRRVGNISPSREPSNSHQVGLQNKFRFHVHRIKSGLFYEYENSTELDEVVLRRLCQMKFLKRRQD